MISTNSSTALIDFLPSQNISESTSLVNSEYYYNHDLVNQSEINLHNNLCSTDLYKILFGYNSLDSIISYINVNSILIINSDENKIRHNSIINSFRKYCKGFPKDKENYISFLANTVCELPFIDNLSYYDEFDECIETVLKLKHNITLSISQFLSEEVDAPVVFSIHKGKTLLIADEMPLKDIVETINSIPE